MVFAFICEQGRTRGMVGILSLLFGIVGILTSFFYVGIFLCIVGMTLGIVGLTDCFSGKKFPLAGLLLSILGVVLSAYVVVSDIDSNKLIIIYNSDDKIYISNYKNIMSAHDEQEPIFLDDSGINSFNEEINSTVAEQMADTNLVENKPLIPYQSIENQTENTYGSVAIQPDKEWYLHGGSDNDKSEEDYQEPVGEQQPNPENEIPISAISDVDERTNSSDRIGITYVLNHNTMKFHGQDCPSANMIKDENREDITISRDEIIRAGYIPCLKCNP